MNLFRSTASALLIVISTGIFFENAIAHPLDVSSTSMTVSGNSVSVVTALHPAEVERILGMRGISMRSLTYGDYYAKKDFIFEYLFDHVTFESAGKACKAEDFSAAERTVDEIFSEGFPVSYSFVCDEPIRTFSVSIRIFTELPLQTNRLSIFSNEGNRLAYKVLTPAIENFSYDFEIPPTAMVDTDSDGLPNEEETAYRTDAEKPDTDSDGYSDGEEVNGGWNPLSSELSPGQSYREDRPWKGTAVQISETRDLQLDRYAPPVSLLDSSVYGASLFRKSLKDLVAFADGPDFQGFGTLFFLVAFLWFIHAAGPGHSKALLVSSIIDRWRGFFSGLAFVLVFTVTHLADVAILVLVTKYLFEVYDVAPYMVGIQRTSAVALAVVASYLLFRAVVKKEKPSSGIPAPWFGKKGIRGTDVLLWFFAGLAPCAFGWSIFLVLFSLGKTEWVLPLLFALWTGIFACLFLVLSITYFFRERILSYAPRLASKATTFSAAFLFLVASYGISLSW